jgi:hypothetical protein
MHAEHLKSLLANNVIHPDNLPQLEEHCDRWFMEDPGVASYVLWQLIRGLVRMWCGEQVLAPEFPLFEKKLLPAFTDVLDQLANGNKQLIVLAIEQLLKTYCECRREATD